MDSILIDLLILFVLLCCIMGGHQKGFVRTFFGFLALFVALIGSAVLTGLLAEPLSRLALPLLEGALEGAAGDLAASAGTAVQTSLTQVLELMERSDLLSGLTDSVRQAVSQGLLVVSSDAAHSVALYLALQLTRLVLFPIFFLLIMLVWGGLTRVLDLTFHLPVLGFVNRTAGAVLGLGKGLLLVFIACWLLKDTYLADSTIRESFLLPFFCADNPLLYISFLNS